MSLPLDFLFLKKVPLVTAQRAISDRHVLDEEAAGVAGNDQVELVWLWFPSIAPLSPGRQQHGRTEGRGRVKKTEDSMHPDAPSPEVLSELDWPDHPFIPRWTLN